MRTPKTSRPTLVRVGEPAPWYASTPMSPAEHRRELEDERSRLFAVADHLPVELAIRAADLTTQLHDAP
jgi:hypothetical protein